MRHKRTTPFRRATIASTALLAIILAISIGAASAHVGLQIIGSDVTPATYAPLPPSPAVPHRQHGGLQLIAWISNHRKVTPYHVRWRIIMTPRNNALLRRIASHAAGPSGMAIANNLDRALTRAGYRADVTVDPDHGAIVIRLLPTFAKSGPLAQYLPGGKTVTAARLKSSLPLLSAAAAARHEHVNLGLDRQTMTLTPTISPAPGRAWGIGTVFSSYGPRYAGSDVLSGYGYAHVGGFNISASVTRGLPGLTPKQSAGGSYLGQSIEIDRPTTAGIFSIAASHAHYLTGGPLRPLHLTGTVTQIRAGDRYPVFDGDVWLKGGMEWSSDRERLGALAWTTTQRDLSAYAAAVAHYEWRGVAVGLHGSVWRGLTGSDSASHGSPNLMGDWSAHYTVERVRLAVARNIGPVRLSGIFGWQHGSAGTPQVMQAYIGGRNRGSSFFTGSFEGPSGYWWSAEVAKAKPVRFQISDVPIAVTPYAGLNGGSVSPDVGPSRSIAAATIGADFQISKHVSGSIGWSHTISQPAGIHQADMVGFDVNLRY